MQRLSWWIIYPSKWDEKWEIFKPIQSAASDSASIIPSEGHPECFTDLFSYLSFVRCVCVHVPVDRSSRVCEDEDEDEDAVLSRLSVSNGNICLHHGCLSSGVFVKLVFTHHQARLGPYWFLLASVSQKQLCWNLQNLADMWGFKKWRSRYSSCLLRWFFFFFLTGSPACCESSVC